MDERLQFVARRLAGEQMADLCREFGISRKTGYKIFVDPVPIRGNLIREWPRAPRQKLSKITLGVPAKHGDVGTTAELVRVAIIQLCEGCGLNFVDGQLPDVKLETENGSASCMRQDVQ